MAEHSDITPPQAQVVCFGMITAGVVLAVDRPPVHNTGQLVSHRAEFISDDAALVVCALREWDVSTALIGTAVGDDAAGRRIADQLKSLGVIGDVRLSGSITTPLEVNVSDPTGVRTFFWQRDPAILDTLNTADLSSIKGSQLLYVDWYDGDRILRPMEEAARLGIPIFLNLEHGHQDNDVLKRYASRATICQAVVDEAQRGDDAEAVVARLLEAGVQTALVTMGSNGSLVADRQGQIRLMPPDVRVVDGCAAGAMFSAGFIYGYLNGWPLEESARFATGAASLNCTVVGPKAYPMEEIERVMARPADR